MARTRKTGAKAPKVGLADRLELIRKRHRTLILEPRKALADEMDEEFDDLFAGSLADDGLELAHVAELERI